MEPEVGRSMVETQLSRVVSVSYTHLDVYKRQHLDCPAAGTVPGPPTGGPRRGRLRAGPGGTAPPRRADPRHRRLSPAGGGGPLPLSPPPVGLRRRPSGVDGGQHRAPGLPGVPARRQLEAYQLAHGRPGAGHAGEPVPDHPAQRAALSAGWGVLLRSLPGLEGAGGGPGGCLLYTSRCV